MTHLTRSELERWRDDAPVAERERVLTHLAVCAACSATYAELVRTRPVTAAPEVFRAADFVETGYASLIRQPSGRRAWSWWAWRLTPLAALVLVAVLVWPAISNRDVTPVVRGGGAGITLVRPVDVTTPVDDLAFEWTRETGIDRVRLQVFDLDAPSQPLIVRDVDGTRYEPTADERARLPRGRALHWFVEFRNARAVTMTTPAARFSVK